jgi:hypothetical protein
MIDMTAIETETAIATGTAIGRRNDRVRIATMAALRGIERDASETGTGIGIGIETTAEIRGAEAARGTEAAIEIETGTATETAIAIATGTGTETLRTAIPAALGTIVLLPLDEIGIGIATGNALGATGQGVAVVGGAEAGVRCLSRFHRAI